MKKSSEKKLRLGKVTIKDLQANQDLDRDLLRNIRGGSDPEGTGITCVKVFC